MIDYDDPSNIVIVHKASEPLDILWKNLGKIEGHFAFTRVLIFIAGFFIIIFLSSPAVMLARLQKLDASGFLSLDWTKSYGSLGKYAHKFIPPLLVNIINVIIINLLDYASVIESYDSHSKYQAAVYLKTVFYMTLNVFIIPVLTIASGG